MKELFFTMMEFAQNDHNITIHVVIMYLELLASKSDSNI